MSDHFCQVACREKNYAPCDEPARFKSDKGNWYCAEHWDWFCANDAFTLQELEELD
jgi:hypothetical protein